MQVNNDERTVNSDGRKGILLVKYTLGFVFAMEDEWRTPKFAGFKQQCETIQHPYQAS